MPAASSAAGMASANPPPARVCASQASAGSTVRSTFVQRDAAAMARARLAHAAVLLVSVAATALSMVRWLEAREWPCAHVRACLTHVHVLRIVLHVTSVS